MFRQVLAFEWRYATTRATFPVTATVLGLLGFVLARTAFGADDIPVNAPYAVAYATGFLSLAAVFALSVFMAPALLRDGEHHMAEILYATAVTPTGFLGGRFAGALLAACSAFVVGMLGHLAGVFTHAPERIAAFGLAPYLGAFALFALPSLFFVAALLFLVAALSRSTLTTHVAGVGVYVLYFVAAIATNSPMLAASGPSSPEQLAVAALIDPFGLSAFFQQTGHWTAAERAVRAIGLDRALLLNRALWLSLGGACLLITRLSFRFRVGQGSKPGGARPPESSARPRDYRPVAVSGGGGLARMAAAIGFELRTATRSWPFAVILVLWIFVTAVELNENLRRAEFGSALLPTGGLLLRYLDRPLLLFGLLVISYFAGEIVWRERTVRIDELVDSTPASNATFLVGKTVTLWLMLLLLAAIGVAVGLLTQRVHGSFGRGAGVLALLPVLGGIPLALFAVLAVLLQTFAPNRHAGMLLTVGAAIVFPLGAAGLEHPLVRYGFTGEVGYSELNGFGPGVKNFLAFAGYWSAVALALAVLAHAGWRRGTHSPLSQRLRALPARLGGVGRLLLGASVVAALGMAAVYAQQLRVNGYRSTESVLGWSAAYERAFGAARSWAQPSITHVDAEFELFPSERRFLLRGRYRLENRTSEKLPSLLVSVPPGLSLSALTLDGRDATAVDPALRVHRFDRPLAAGDSAELAFELEVTRRGVAHDVVHDIVENGTLLFGPRMFPALGYRRAYEIDDASLRRAQGLPARLPDTVAPPWTATFEFLVSTEADQRAVAPGDPVESWLAGGRSFTRFRSARPMPALAVVASARYAVAVAQADGVLIEVLYHPGHEQNVPRILEAARRSMVSFTRRFGPYPFRGLRIAEVPGYDERFAGFAPPGVIFLTEDRAFLTDLRDETRIDIVGKRVAHEVAHQWWGNQVVPPSGPGASAVVESLARYSELLILEELYGGAAVAPVLAIELEKYLSGRARDDEVPLVQVDDQPWLYYSKGAVVTMATRELLGEERMDAALRAIVDRARRGETIDAQVLVAALTAQATPEDRVLLGEWWSEIVLYELAVTAAASTAEPDGRHRIDARVAVEKSALQGGAEARRPTQETVEVEVLAADGARVAITRVRSGEDLSLRVEGSPPFTVVVDPEVRRLDRNPANNSRRALER